jgi:PAS domain S-box-containing protein
MNAVTVRARTANLNYMHLRWKARHTIICIESDSPLYYTFGMRGPMSSGMKHILLVEDEAIICMATKMILERNGFNVVTVADGEKSIEIADTNPSINLILMDINLGTGIDGTEAAQAILAKHDVPIIFLSSHTEPEVVEKTEGITSYGYIVKNSGETVLLASIKMAFKLFESKRALAHSRDLMSYIIAHNRSGVAVHDREYKYVYVSKQYLEDYNLLEQDIIGKHHYEVFPDLPQKWRDVHKKALMGEVSSAEDDIFERADGSVQYTRWECRPWYEADGSIGGFIIYTEDITRKKLAEIAIRKSEEKYRATIHTMKDGFWTVNMDGKFTDVNESYSRMSGYSISELLGMGIADIDVLDNYNAISDRIDTIRRQGSYDFVSKHRRKDGLVIEVEISARCHDDEILCFCRDITKNAASTANR